MAWFREPDYHSSLCWRPMSEEFPSGEWLYMTRDPSNPDCTIRFKPRVPHASIVRDWPEMTHWAREQAELYAFFFLHDAPPFRRDPNIYFEIKKPAKAGAQGKAKGRGKEVREIPSSLQDKAVGD